MRIRPDSSDIMSSTPVILHATFTSTPGNAALVATLLRDYAATVRQEPGNAVFEATQHADNPDAFFVYEEYVDHDAFQAHLAAPSGAAFNAVLVPLIVEPSSNLTFLTRI